MKMNYGTPTVWELMHVENSTKSGEQLSEVGSSQSSLGDMATMSMTPEVAYMGKIAYGIVAPIIISFGIFTNILNLVVLTRPTLRGPTYRYLMWLAVANLLVCIILLPFTLHSHHTPVRYFAALYIAHLEMPFGNALIASSVYIVVGLSIDRFVAVCHPRKYRNLHSHRVASVRIAFSFIIGFFIYIPMSLGKKVVRAEGSEGHFLPKENFTVTNTKWWIVYKCFLEICARFAPAFLLAFLNIWIIIEFKKVSRRRRNLKHSSVEISGVPSQSMVDVSQSGTTQHPPKEEMSHILDQLRETRNYNGQNHLRVQISKFDAKYSGTKGQTSTSGSSSQENCSSDSRENDERGEIEMAKLVSEEKTTEQQANGNCCKTTSFSVTTISNSSYHSLNNEEIIPGDENQMNISNGETKTNEVDKDETKMETRSYIFSPSELEKHQNLRDQYRQSKEDTQVQEIEIAHITIKGSRNPGKMSRKAMSARRLDMERRLILLLVVIIIAFFITNIPTAILSLTNTENKRTSLPYQIFRAIANNLEFLNFGLNFVLYFLFSQDIRKTFMTLLRKTFRKVSKRFFNSSSTSKIPNKM